MSIFWFVWRMIGVVLFEITGIRKLLVFFPNMFENFFLFIEIYKRFRSEHDLTFRKLIYWNIFLFVLKLPIELLLHWYEAQPWNWFQVNILGLKTLQEK
ncbi:MAG: hypothetical protein Q9M91_00670 [Candidatus Dojkabacteria bacterium]|nr:hypothetical protein [Candidatus Dojkabacteria bacterium]